MTEYELDEIAKRVADELIERGVFTPRQEVHNHFHAAPEPVTPPYQKPWTPYWSDPTQVWCGNDRYLWREDVPTVSWN